jgi:hypothetical protein
VVKRCVRVYIEGGAEGKLADSDFRRNWKKFLNELHEIARASGKYHKLEVVRGKGRGNAFRSFRQHKVSHPNDLCVLLVDSEEPVAAGKKVWPVVAQRKGDRWKQPVWAEERHLYLMVEAVETWLLTDQDALHEFFGSGFVPNGLPTINLETRNRAEIDQALQKATEKSSKGTYRHGHANHIIGLVRPERVKTLSHGKRLFEVLAELINA